MSRRHRSAAPAPKAAARAPMRVDPALVEDFRSSLLPQAPALTEEEIRRLFGPPMTLGAGAKAEEARTAMDGALADAGVYTLLAHSARMGQLPMAQFMGYGMLQNISQNGLVRACVSTVADDMTRAWVKVKRDGPREASGGQLSGIPEAPAGFGSSLPDAGSLADQDAPDTLPALQEALDALQPAFHEAASLVGYEGGAFLFIDTGAVGPELETPLNVGPRSAELRQGAPLRFAVIDPVNTFPGDYNSLDPLRADYFRPRWWWILGQRVHASRLIRLVANEPPLLLKPAYNFLGIPQAQILWDYVLHFQECRVAEARLLKKFSMTVFKTDLFDSLNALTPERNAVLNARISYMVQNMSNDGVLAVDKEKEEVVKLETPLSGVTDIVRQSLEILAAMNRTPAVKLLGISPSGFNATGESDVRNYYDHVTSQQEKVLRSGIRRALDCLQLVTTGRLDKSLTFDFAPLGEEDRAALTNYQKGLADTAAIYLDRQVLSPEEVRRKLSGDKDSGYAFIDPEEVPEQAENAALAGFGVEGLEEGGGGAEGKPRLDDTDSAGAVWDASLPGLDSSRAWLFWRAEDAEFDEGQHPRDESGQFAKAGGGSSSSGPQDITDLLGEEIKGVKGKRAVEALLERQGGHVKGAFHRDDIGDIDLFWGDDSCGLKHIIKRREEEGEDIDGVLANLSSVIAQGRAKRDYGHEDGPDDKKWIISKGHYKVSVSAMLRGNKMTYVLTAFED